MDKKQSEIFFENEGDNWYKRNKDKILFVDSNIDFPLKILELYKIKPKKVLEIGCSIGSRLNYIKQTYKSECFGIDASKEAIL